MNQDPGTSHPIDRLTQFAMGLSRRRFFQVTGATGLALAGPLAGLSRLLQLNPKTPAINCVMSNCSDPCTGLCDACESDCIAGGEKCVCTCSGGCGGCTPTAVEAHGIWFWFNPTSNCIFDCQCDPCTL